MGDVVESSDIDVPMKYRRVLLKLSGEALMGEKQFGIDNQQLALYAREVEGLVKAGVECAIVIGGGNIFRGVQAVSYTHLTLPTIYPV